MENHPDITVEAIYEERKRAYHMLLTIIDLLEDEANLQTPVLQVCKDLLAQAQHRYLISSDAWHDIEINNKCKSGSKKNDQTERTNYEISI